MNRPADREAERGALPNTDMREARAKVNVFLRVLGRRPDGYHELETLIARISLADRLEIHAFSDPAQFRTLSLSLHVTGESRAAAGVPTDQSNLVLRAAAALAEHAGVLGFADITLDKRIPAAAGLGGGSADAASTLMALDELWGLGAGAEELRRIAAAVGSDVPALMHPNAALARGRGELTEPVRVPPLSWCLLTFPFGVRTAEAFAWWDQEERAAGTGPDPQTVLQAAMAGDPGTLGPLLFNDLEPPVVRRHPEIGEAKDALLEAGAVGAVMCGSGPTVAGLLPAGASCVLPEAIMVRSGED
jgi:4-diphosphocytidyl-2-C-methyl-D-erythritol kinase